MTATSNVIKFPFSVSRRAHARRPRRSKNGTPSERRVAAAPADPRVRTERELFELIALTDRHKLTWTAYAEASHACGHMHATNPGFAQAEALSDERFEEYREARQALMDFTPTTVSSALSMLGYVDAFNRGNTTAASEAWQSEPTERGDWCETDPDAWPWLLLRKVTDLLQSLHEQQMQAAVV